ncbi:MAG TPA: hypothetical protein DEG76_01215 [Pseudohongiella sp.]|nr:hypothetical protein [Pseudohongiella sp.]
MMNITESQVDGMEAFLAQRDIATNAFYPMMTAGLVSVNGEPPRNPWDDDDDEGQQNLTERSGQLNEMSPQDGQSADAQSEGEEGERERVINRQVTYTDSLPPDNQIVAGEWWSGEDIAGQVSVEDDYASRLGVSLGDELVFRVGEDEVTVTVTSMRSVRWDNMQPNFFFIFSPGTLDYLGATYLSTLLLEGEEKLQLNELLRQFPTIVVLEVDALIEQIQTIIAQVSSAIELIAVLVLLSGALVLLACVNATLDERFRENAILRTLGAGRRLILNALLLEFAFIGLLAGLIATIGAELSLYYLQTQVFGQDFRLHYWVWFAGPLAGTIIIAALGVNATRRVVNTSPLAVLRQLTV